MKTGIRKFQHIEGFKDDTAYIECNETGTSVIVLNNGMRVNGYAYNLEYCLNKVIAGVWKEIT